MKSPFKIKREHDKHYRFEMMNEAGQFLFSSVTFANKQDAKRSIAQLQASDAHTLLFERETNYDGKFRFNLKTSDSQILGKSGPFESQAGMENGIKQLKNRITDLTT